MGGLTLGEWFIEKNVNGVITRYVYDREDILFELDGNNNIITEYVHGPGIDEPIAMLRNNQTYYYHADGLGSIIAITNSAGQVVQRYEYNSFGEITYVQDPNFIQPYTYTGREYDNESGLYYYRARYYDAKIGRFLQQDPILSPINLMNVTLSQADNKIMWVLPYFTGNPEFLRPYIYTGNDPLNHRDPTGLHGFMLFGKQPFIFRYPGVNRLAPSQRYIPPRPTRQCPIKEPPLRHIPTEPPPLKPESWWGDLLQKLADLLGEMGFGSQGPYVVNPQTRPDML